MALLREGELEFDFGPAWNDSAIKFDEDRVYQRARNALEGTKGVDFVGVFRSDLILVEVKDLRHHRIENKKRIANGDLTTEVGQKVKDTVACIVGSVRVRSEPKTWRRYTDIMLDNQKQIKVILWLEEDSPASGNLSVRHNVLKNELKRKLKWLQVRADVQCIKTTSSDDLNLRVRYLPTTKSG